VRFGIRPNPRLLLAATTAALLVPAGALAQSPAAAAGTASPAPDLREGPAAHITTTGDLTADLVLPFDPTSELPTGDGSFDLRWQDTELNTLILTLDVAGGAVTSAFVGAGLPGTSIEDPTYFADFVRSQCTVTADGLDTDSVTGTIDCTDLENAMSGADAKTIALTASFSAGASPVVSPAPEPSGEAAAPDTIHLVTSGDVTTDLVLPRTDETTFVDSGTGTELVFADSQGNTARITFDVDSSAEPPLTNAFVALGLPGKSLFDPAFFPDALRTQCTLTPTTVTDAEIAGTIACSDLPSADGTMTIDTTGTFSVTR
jgi:hypothetical protein